MLSGGLEDQAMDLWAEALLTIPVCSRETNSQPKAISQRTGRPPQGHGFPWPPPLKLHLVLLLPPSRRWAAYCYLRGVR